MKFVVKGERFSWLWKQRCEFSKVIFVIAMEGKERKEMEMRRIGGQFGIAWTFWLENV